MNTIRRCQFTTYEGPCPNDECSFSCPVRFSPVLQMFLCASHEIAVITDHLRQHFDAQIESMVEDMLDQQFVYMPFSTDAYTEFPDALHSAPDFLQPNQCLFEYDASCETNNGQMEIVFCIKNDLTRLIQFGGLRGLYARSNPNVLHVSFPLSADRMDRMEHVRRQASDAAVAAVLVRRLTMHTRYVHVLDTQSPHTMALTEQVRQHILHDIMLLNDTPHDRDDNASECSMVTETSAPLTRRMYMSDISACDVCNTHGTQTGFRMVCCDPDNQVCAECVITHALTEYTKTYSVLDIVDMSLFENPHKCFFCNRLSMYVLMETDAHCKSLFTDIVTAKVDQELTRRKIQQAWHLAKNLM